MFQTYENPQSSSPAEKVSVTVETIRNIICTVDKAMRLLKEALPDGEFIMAEATDSPEAQICCRVVRAEYLNTELASTPLPSAAQDHHPADPRRNGKIPPDSTV